MTDPEFATSSTDRTDGQFHGRLGAARAGGRIVVEVAFRTVLATAGMLKALALLNARTRYRFTGVYRAVPPELRNVCLFDRENPSLLLGGDIAPLDRTYCGIVAATQTSFFAADAPRDPRLSRHPARDSIVSYAGVPVRMPDGRIFGTLCHFDLRPRILPLDELAVLESISPCISEWITASGGSESTQE